MRIDYQLTRPHSTMPLFAVYLFVSQKVMYSANFSQFTRREDEGAHEIRIYRERLMTRWRRECLEVDEALKVVERESEELGDIEGDPSKIAMQKAKLKVRLGNFVKQLRVKASI